VRGVIGDASEIFVLFNHGDGLPGTVPTILHSDYHCIGISLVVLKTLAKNHDSRLVFSRFHEEVRTSGKLRYGVEHVLRLRDCLSGRFGYCKERNVISEVKIGQPQRLLGFCASAAGAGRSFQENTILRIALC
jgi:hypothetical protein